jgi:hypothetical protein
MAFRRWRDPLPSGLEDRGRHETLGERAINGTVLLGAGRTFAVDHQYFAAADAEHSRETEPHGNR